MNTGDWQAISIPVMKPLTISELPPDEINGMVTPVNGIMLHEPKMLSPICTANAAQIPVATVPWKYERGGFIRGIMIIIRITKIIMSE